ncbi:hypothetical protein BDZ97DRAFT_1919832 [Flammula alnicola]|nr:hypothetical protein BDZ97DRAFT_1919832 [Flammula alnicola]
MSSRAAASRKRLVPGEAKRPSSSKGFFSRSKTATPTPPRIDLTAQHPFPPTQTSIFPSTSANRDSHGLSTYRTEVEVTEQYPYVQPDPFAVERSRATSYGQSNTPILKKATAGPIPGSTPSSAYPSPPHEEFIPRQIVRLNPPSPRRNGPTPNDYNSGVSYVEASYQPPPPIQASYQPPPPSLQSTQSTRTNGQRALPNPPSKSTASSPEFDSFSGFPAPPGYPPPVPFPDIVNPQFSLPTPSTSPPQTSVLLQRYSPTPTELPTYSSAYEVSSYTPLQPGQPPLQVSIHNSPLSPHARAEYVQYHESYSYPSPPSPQPHRFIPSPLRIPDLPAQSATSLPLENDLQRPWYHGVSGSGNSAPSSPAQAAFHIPPTATSYRPTRPPESISGSSDSSGSKSPASNDAPKATSSTFVFPGSRSVARPKVSSKTGTPVLKMKGKSRFRKESETQPTSPVPPTPSSDTSSYSQPPSAGVADAFTFPDGNGRSPIIQTHPDSLSLSSSDDSEIGRSTKASNGNSTTGSSTSRNSTAGSSTSGSSTSGETSPRGYIFPVGRSRAQPSKVPTGIKVKGITRQRPHKSSSDEGERDERPRFMGLLLKKKKAKAPELFNGSSTVSSGFEIGNSSRDAQSPNNADGNLRYEEAHATNPVHSESRERAKRIRSRIGNYPLDPYDSVLLDNDRHTGELLVRLNPTGSPSFHNYGNSPPTSVLDLGCGQGHWVVDAAIAWKGYGTKVTGYDMVDISKGLLPWAVEQGVTDNIRFVRGNFLKQRLPFSDNSFDMVRMSCLALCITSDSWIFVLQEVCRVLQVGGRLELIDDLIFFPYRKASSSLDCSTRAQIESVAPRLDIAIPSSSFTTFSIYDGETTNPGLGASLEDPEPEDVYELYGVEEEEAEFDDTETVNGRETEWTRDESPNPRAIPRPATVSNHSIMSSRSWNRAFATSGDLESLFEHMLTHKFGIRKDPSEFVLDLMKEVFGHAREVKTMHLTLAPPETGIDGDNGLRGHQQFEYDNSEALISRGGHFRSASGSRRESMGLSKSPGLILWPSTFIPMDQSEIEIHASKHLRMLLSCKNLLLEHALEATDDEEIDEESVLEALWEYEGFNPPPPSSISSSGDQGDQGSDTVSIRGSIAESVSSDSREAMWEIQSTPKVQDNTPTTLSFPPASSPSPTPLSQSLTRNGRRETVSSNAAPVYSRDELTHVRTFRVYEAIKIDESIFGTAI